MPTLQVRGLTRRFEGGALTALDDVSFDAQAGEMVALMGPSGCGKSTLLSLIGLLDKPTSGQVRIEDVDLSDARHAARFRARTVGFVFQFHHLLPTMTLLENVCAPLIALGVARRERIERGMGVLSRVGLEHRATALPQTLSGGERQRGAVGRALVALPPVVLADEPTGNLDTGNGEAVVQLLRDHATTRGALVIIATHNPEIVRQADRVITLRDGRVIGIRHHQPPARDSQGSSGAGRAGSEGG
jgi:ABC-type lipoprotein export system ATPase subunit